MRILRYAQHDVSTAFMSLCAFGVTASGAAGQFGGSSDSMMNDGPHATMRLAIETERLVPGEQEIAVVFSIDEGWHLYWENPGETGLAPTVKLSLPEGVEQVGDLRWPAPERYVHGGGEILDYIYEGEVALLAAVRVSDALVGSDIEIGADGFWLVCKEACIPGDGSATLHTEVGESAGGTTEDADIIAASRGRIPGESDDVAVSWDGLTLDVRFDGGERMEFFPLAPDVGGPSHLIEDGATLGERLRVRYDERVRGAERVRGVVGVEVGGTTRFFSIDAASPRPRE